MGLCAVLYSVSDACVPVLTLLSTSDLPLPSRAFYALTIWPWPGSGPHELSPHLLRWFSQLLPPGPSFSVGPVLPLGTGGSGEGLGGGVLGKRPSQSQSRKNGFRYVRIPALSQTLQPPVFVVLPASPHTLSYEKVMELELLSMSLSD